MTAIRLSDAGDFALPLQSTDNPTDIAQDRIRLRLRERQGARLLDVLYGLPWDRWALDEVTPSPVVVAAAVRQQLGQVPGVTVVSVTGDGSEQRPSVRASVSVDDTEGGEGDTLSLVIPLYATQGAPAFYLYTG